MQGNVSRKGYFRADRGRVNLYDAFVRAVRDRLLSEAEGGRGKEEGSIKTLPVDPLPSTFGLIKRWRDQLIRDLTDKGRVTHLHDYSRFLDEAAPDASDPLLLQWKANILNLVGRMQHLDARGALNEANVLGLLKGATHLPPVSMPFRTVAAELLGFDSPENAPLILPLPSAALPAPDAMRGRAASEVRATGSQGENKSRLNRLARLTAQTSQARAQQLQTKSAKRFIPAKYRRSGFSGRSEVRAKAENPKEVRARQFRDRWGALPNPDSILPTLKELRLEEAAILYNGFSKKDAFQSLAQHGFFLTRENWWGSSGDFMWLKGKPNFFRTGYNAEAYLENAGVLRPEHRSEVRANNKWIWAGIVAVPLAIFGASAGIYGVIQHKQNVHFQIRAEQGLVYADPSSFYTEISSRGEPLKRIEPHPAFSGIFRLTASRRKAAADKGGSKNLWYRVDLEDGRKAWIDADGAVALDQNFQAGQKLYVRNKIIQKVAK